MSGAAGFKCRRFHEFWAGQKFPAKYPHLERQTGPPRRPTAGPPSPMAAPPQPPQELNLYQGSDTWSVKQDPGGKWTFTASGATGPTSMAFAGDLVVRSALGTDYVDVFTDIKANDAAISAATAGYQAADAALSDEVAALASTSAAETAAVAADLAVETSRAIAAEGVNTTKIQQEKSRAEAAEATLTASLTTETDRAVSAEQALSSSLSTLQTTVANVISNTDAAALDSLTELADKIGENATNINARFARIEETLTQLTNVTFPDDYTLT